MRDREEKLEELTADDIRAVQEESEEIDRQVEELMAPGDEQDSGKKKKKKKRSGPGLGKRWRSFSGRKKVLIAVLVVLVAGGIYRGVFVEKKPSVIMVSVVPLQKRDIEERISLSGPVSGTDSVDVVSNIHAEIIQMDVKEGDKVTKGQILAVLDRTDLAREVEIAKNAYDLAVSNKQEKDKEASLGYEKAVQDFQKASLDYNRNSQLFAAGDISQMELEQSANAMNDTRRQVAGYTVVNGHGAADKSYEIQVENALFDLQKKQEELQNTEIKSTIDGTVVRVNSKVGQFADKVLDDKPIFSIENLDQLELEIKVSEFSIGKVKVGQKAEIHADILDEQTETGEVTKISPTGEEKGGGSSERVIPTTIRIEGGNTKLIAGITARAQLLIKDAKDAFVVPAAAVLDQEETTNIQVVKDGIIKWIPVEIGVDGDLNVQIIATGDTPLEDGMQVVSTPDANLTDGTAVQIMPQ